MKKQSITAALILLLLACMQSVQDQKQDPAELSIKGFRLNLGGEEQYIEILSTSDQHPVLLFVHGGPAWPQTPQIRYFNADLATHYTVVVWEQRGAGLNYKPDHTPDSLSLERITNDGLELSAWLLKEYKTPRIYLAGYSWGSLVGVQMAQQRPDYYKAYFGIAQFINKEEGMRISRDWLRKQAEGDEAALARVDSLEHPEFYSGGVDRFFQQYLMVNSYGGALHNPDASAEIKKAEQAYPDYADYPWDEAWERSSTALEPDLYNADVRSIRSLDVPVVLFLGRHDWNVPSVLAASWLEGLDVPGKRIVWFENSGHSPLEEEPGQFNRALIQQLDDLE